MKFDDVIKSEFYKLSTLGGQMLFDKAVKEIEYLKSLKPTIPKFVAKWFEESIKNQMDIYSMVDYYVSSDSRLPSEIKSWMDAIDDGSKIEITLANMVQFGYNIIYDTKYIIKAPVAWRDYAEDDQYVAVSETERYELVDISEADKFTKEEAEILMDNLRVNWELVEVRENAWNK